MESSVFQDHFVRETEALLLRWLRLGLSVGIVLYAGFFFLDLIVAPGHLEFAAAIRLFVILAAGLTIWATHFEWGRKRLVFLSVVVLYVAASGISLMTTRLGGFSSNYYFGILLVLFFAGLFMPWKLKVTAIFSGLVCGTYFLLNGVFHGPSLAMAPAAFFLVSTSVFTCLATESSLRNRRRDLALRLRLEKANEDLTRLHEAKTRFFSNVSHELRTPLTLILGPIESILREEKDRERAKLLQAVLSNSQRLLRQVNLLLETAKLEAGSLALELEETDLAEVLSELVAASRPYAERRGLEIKTIGLQDPIELSLDRDKVEMIAANLLSNALKFTPSGGTITVKAKVAGRGVVFEVEDTGPGVPKEQRERIFDRFHQLDTSLSREEGTGLGLSLARELARLHGGDVTVSDGKLEGALFRVQIPLTPQQQTVDRRQQSRRKVDRLAMARTRAMAAMEFETRSRSDTLLADVRRPRLLDETRTEAEGPDQGPLVLIVEDNPDLRVFLARQLSSVYRVATAKDGLEGLDLARKHRPALIVLDVMMPRMDGYEVCRELKKDAGLATIPVILVTAKAGSEAIVEGLETGADDYVTKPFSPEELEARIAAHLRAKEVERQLHEKESRLAAIGQLTSTVVHEVRNTLMLIQGHSDVATSTAVGGGSLEDVLADLNEIKAASRRLQRMSTEILEYARGGGELNKKLIPAGEYLSSVFRGLEVHLAGQGIAASVEFEIEEDALILIDQDRFQRVFENLVFNARDALTEHIGDREVSIQAARRKGALEVRIADTGPGISPDIADRLFEPFASKKKRGTGLGLATVRNLVKAHGGEVRVEPKAPEGGAAFTVVIPLGAENSNLRLVEEARPVQL